MARVWAAILTTLAIILAIPAIADYLFGGTHPRVLIRFTASRAIAAAAEFQHKTTLYFEIGEFESFLPDACHNFEFAPQHVSNFTKYLETGIMKFKQRWNQLPPFSTASSGSFALETAGFLVDHIDVCAARPAISTTGAYELAAGRPIVQVSGIRSQGNRAFADFRWHFTPLNNIVRQLPLVQNTRAQQVGDGHLTPEEKAIAPYWSGSAEFAKYDDGWRVVAIDLKSGRLWERWEYGPDWPDPQFNWNAQDEHNNRY